LTGLIALNQRRRARGLPADAVADASAA
jgi:hypothetical protein